MQLPCRGPSVLPASRLTMKAAREVDELPRLPSGRSPAKARWLGSLPPPAIGARSVGLPRIWMTRVMWYAKADSRMSARTFSKPLMRQEPGSFQCLLVPTGCATSCWRCCLKPGCASPLVCRRSRMCACPQRVMRRPSVCRMPCAVSPQVRQAVVASDRIGRPSATVAQRQVKRWRAGP